MSLTVHPDLNTSAWPGPSTNVSGQPAVRVTRLSPAQQVLVVMVTASLSVVTVLGNLLVILSIKVNSRLRTVNNYFLLSLAAADLIVGLLSMNLYTLYRVRGQWPLGAALCDTWLVLDYAVSSASVMNLLLISLDRYLCMTRLQSYSAWRTRKMAGLMIGAAWVLSFVLWAPAILCWQSAGSRRVVPEGHCYIQLLVSPAVTLGTDQGSESSVKRNDSIHKEIRRSTDLLSRKDLHWRASEALSTFRCQEGRRQRVMARERRVTKTILAILLAFILTWTPYNIMAVVAAFCHICIPDVVWSLGYWLCYVNSAINPGCYALCNTTFRRTFCSLLHCDQKWFLWR
uniref:Muscarinic acetylcholine receptor n=1 Tax=Oryzias latipes TaxID=8090 RepID=A0A3B3IBR6_ORYLA